MTSVAKFDQWQSTAGTPRKTVINIQEYLYPSTNDAYTTVAADTDWNTPITITYTPLYATSTLLIEGSCQFRCSPSYGVVVGIKRDGNKIQGSNNRGGLLFMYKEMTTNHHYQCSVKASVLAGSTAATTFTVFVNPYNGSGDFSAGWGNNSIRVMEVAG